MLGNVVMSRHRAISNAILDKNVYVAGSSAADHNTHESIKFFHVSPGGVVVVSGGAEVT